MSPKTMRNRILQVEFVAPPRTKSAESDLAEAIPELSPRELQCLRLAAKGTPQSALVTPWEYRPELSMNMSQAVAESSVFAIELKP
jgi:hypothetical protein